MTNAEQPHSKYPHVHAIIRIDLPLDQGAPENSIAVVKVMSSKLMAEDEITRLNNINAGKSCRYTLQTTRLS
ncbi:MAG TPA: hypothetical protein VHN74_15905 [Candidatus Angelobacter sp.]|jgi:hypothetical protein|nr:hypothetical protein [Candidatus Angelobacter sp.]